MFLTYQHSRYAKDYDEADEFATAVAKDLTTNWNPDTLTSNMHPNIFIETPKEYFVKQIKAAKVLGSYKNITLTDSFVTGGSNRAIPSDSLRPAGKFEYLAEFATEKVGVRFDLYKDDKLGWKVVYFCLLPPQTKESGETK